MKSRKDIALALIKKEDVANSYLHIFFQFVFQLIITPIPVSYTHLHVKISTTAYTRPNAKSIKPLSKKSKNWYRQDVRYWWVRLR